MYMSSAKTMKWITAGLEGFLAIPIIGGFFVISFGYFPLIIMLALHIVTLVLSNKDRTTGAGSILGIITSIIAWIPFIGWFMHLITAVVLVLEAVKKDIPFVNENEYKENKL